MNIRELLQTDECEFLDFKYEMYQILSSDSNRKLREKMELFRDITSLINVKDPDIETNESYLVIGIGETNKKYDGRHNNIDFTITQSIIQLIREFIEPSLSVEFNENYISGDNNNLTLSENPLPNYDRVITIIFKRELGTVYELKKEMGNRDLGFERVGAAYTRDESHKRRITEKDRNKIRDVLDVRLMLTFEQNSSEFILQKPLKKIFTDAELDEKLKRLEESLSQDLNSLTEESFGLDNSKKEKIVDLFTRIGRTDYMIPEITEADWEEYNKNVDSYIMELKSFLKERLLYFEELNQILSLNLELHNNGKEMAADIDAFLIIPESCEFIDELPQFQLELPKRPKKPKPSLRSVNPLGGMAETMKQINKSLTSNFSESVSNILSPAIYSLGMGKSQENYLIEDNQTLKLSVEKLKQGYYLTINNILIKVPSITDYPELLLQFGIIVGRPSKTFNDKLLLKIDTR